MIKVIISIVCSIIITYIVVGLVYGYKKNIPSWASKLFYPIIQIVKSNNNVSQSSSDVVVEDKKKEEGNSSSVSGSGSTSGSTTGGSTSGSTIGGSGSTIGGSGSTIGGSGSTTGGSTTGGSGSGVPTQQEIQCTKDYNSLTTFNPKFDTIDIPNKDNIKTFCDIGNTIITNKCTNVNPTLQSNYKKFCCDGSNDLSKCGEHGSKCILNSISFNSSKNPTSISNPQSVDDYCSLGRKLVADECKSVIPTNNSSFSNYCCNGSTKFEDCTPFAQECTVDSANFKLNEVIMSDFTPGSNSIQSNSDKINSYCALGKKIIDRNCSQLLPINSQGFKQLCCNGSSDKTKCSSTAACAINGSSFISQDKQLEGVPKLNLQSSIESVKKYCKTGISLISDNCGNDVIPTNSATFKDLCCNESSDPLKCSENALSCTLGLTDFMNKDYTATDTNITNASGQTSITQYCNMGYDLLNKGCNSTSIITPNFKKYCCNGSSDPTKCNPTSLTCMINSTVANGNVNSFTSSGYPTTPLDISTRSSQFMSVSDVKNYCSTLDAVKTDSSCPINKTYSSLCAEINCLPNYLYHEDIVNRLSGDSDSGKRANSGVVCPRAKQVVDQCPILGNKVKSYGSGFYNSYCV
jgi:hypothetical protein